MVSLVFASAEKSSFHAENYQCVKIIVSSYELFTLHEIKSNGDIVNEGVPDGFF